MDSKSTRTLTTDLLNLTDGLDDDDRETARLYLRLQMLKRCKKSNQKERVLKQKQNVVVHTLVKCLGIDVIGLWRFLTIVAVGLLAFSWYRNYFEMPFGSGDNPVCLMLNPQVVQEAARAEEKCDVCKGLKNIPVEYNITRERFIQKYAYSNLPVLIKGGITNWTATKVFGLEYFKNVYSKFPDGFKVQRENAQFFTYRDEFNNLKEVLYMTKRRLKKPYYFGWSNLHQGVAKELRKHYQRPYFLPADSESSDVDWIFMGTSGPGAVLHLDYVARPSWQAQIQGHKQWTMVPSSECKHICPHALNVTVAPGDIIVVDTNRWFHSTYVHPGNVSICIGSEYD